MAKLHLLVLLCCGGGAASAFTIPTKRPPRSSDRIRRQRFHPSRRKGPTSGLRLNKRRELPFAPTTALGAHLETDETTNGSDAALSRALESKDLDTILPYLQSHRSSIPSLNNGQLTSIFDAIELATAESEENTVNKRTLQDANISSAQIEFQSLDRVRLQMTRLYRLLQEEGRLKVFGAVGRPSSPLEGPVFPTSGSKLIAPKLLETITGIEMVNLTPRSSNLLAYGGAALAVLEIVISLYLDISFNLLVVSTLLLAIADQVLVSGAVSETALRMAQPEMALRVTKHEAGHFLCAYLLGCPVEGVVLSTWAALKDERFRGRSSGAVSAGTSYYDLDLSEQVAGARPLTRDSIDRYSVIVMGGIAAEATEFGRADGGAGDEEALVRFLRSLNPRSGNAVSAWSPELIRNQARWGATQAVLLLKEYKPCYDALVDALERGGDLGRCVAAIEGAATREGLGQLRQPLGKVSEEGEFGGWVTMDDVDRDVNENGGIGSTPQVNNGSPSSVTPVPTYGEDPITSTEEFLRKYRDVMEKKLASIDEQLEEMDSNKQQ